MGKNNEPVSANMEAANKLNDLSEELMKMSGSFLHDITRMQGIGERFSKSELVNPDPFGCESWFVSNFITPDMEDEFRFAAREFYLHEYTHLREYELTDYVDLYADTPWPEGILVQYTMNLMVNAANAGSEYAKALILYLHKIFYRNEYKTLKRFRTLSLSELLALSKPDREHPSYIVNNARILYVAKLSGIEISEDCNMVFAFLTDMAKEQLGSLAKEKTLDIHDIYLDCLKEVQEKHESKRMYNVDAKMCSYLKDVLSWYGFPPDYVEMCDEDNRTLTERLATTLAILRKKHPTKEYTLTELSLYAAIFHCVGALTSTADWILDAFDSLALGRGHEIDMEEDEIRFRAEDISINERKETAKIVNPVKQPAATVAVQENAEEKENLLRELGQLRRKVHMLETENTDFRIKLNEKRKLEDEIRMLRTQAEADSKELIALRNFAYHQTEEDTPSAEIPVEQMKTAIEKLHIVIIGGHTNWVSKLRNMFSNWSFVEPEASGSTDASIVEKADFAFFFTDTISHSRYHQFMSVIREKRVNLGYIHGVNIEKNIRDIYHEVVDSE